MPFDKKKKIGVLHFKLFLQDFHQLWNSIFFTFPLFYATVTLMEFPALTATFKIMENTVYEQGSFQEIMKGNLLLELI